MGIITDYIQKINSPYEDYKYVFLKKVKKKYLNKGRESLSSFYHKYVNKQFDIVYPIIYTLSPVMYRIKDSKFFCSELVKQYLEEVCNYRTNAITPIDIFNVDVFEDQLYIVRT